MEHELRDYRKDPLSEGEIREILDKLGCRAAEVVRRRDPAWRELDLEGADDEALVEAMAGRPGLLERPIAIRGERAVVARPPETVRELL
ncbi:MAG: ArsC/Spx/MgsR family protein [Gemmatimonadota bacterium]|nr:ArsC/Spx/MgsR family protein [Gemmatimonadota bacterium]